MANRTFRLAFMSSMWSIAFLASQIPGFGLVLGVLPLFLTIAVSGRRYAAYLLGMELTMSLPSTIANFVSGSTVASATYSVSTNPDIMTRAVSYLLTVLPFWAAITVVVGSTLLDVVYLWVLARSLIGSIRNYKRIRRVLVTLGVIPAKIK